MLPLNCKLCNLSYDEYLKIVNYLLQMIYNLVLNSGLGAQDPAHTRVACVNILPVAFSPLRCHIFSASIRPPSNNGASPTQGE